MLTGLLRIEDKSIVGEQEKVAENLSHRRDRSITNSRFYDLEIDMPADHLSVLRFLLLNHSKNSIRCAICELWHVQRSDKYNFHAFKFRKENDQQWNGIHQSGP